MCVPSGKMKKISKYGFEYYTELPAGWRLATLGDFHRNGLVRIGMEFIIHGYHMHRYELCVVKEGLKASYLKPFIDDGRVYVKENS